jgi:hypothetical protein
LTEMIGAGTKSFETLGPGRLFALRAERDIKQNWSVFRDRFLRGEWP